MVIVGNGGKVRRKDVRKSLFVKEGVGVCFVFLFFQTAGVAVGMWRELGERDLVWIVATGRGAKNQGIFRALVSQRANRK